MRRAHRPASPPGWLSGASSCAGENADGGGVFADFLPRDFGLCDLTARLCSQSMAATALRARTLATPRKNTSTPNPATIATAKARIGFTAERAMVAAAVAASAVAILR
jgi:hypothetical protein